MGLSLTSTAAPGLELAALDQKCRGRGLDGVELVLDATEAPGATAERVVASGARVVALRAQALELAWAVELARLAARLGVPVSVPPGVVANGDVKSFAEVFAAEGARLLLSVPTNLERAAALLETIEAAGQGAALGLAWELRPSSEPLHDAGAVLFATRDHLGLVRLYGGGPEQGEQDGLGIGALFVDLALSKYTGPVVLCPSGEEALPRWGQWLESRRTAGCGTVAERHDLHVDVRPVEPKDRLETILGAYKSLRKGAILKLTVDHDPSCMYYMLEATEPEGSFDFKVLEHGPEVWRAEVKRT